MRIAGKKSARMRVVIAAGGTGGHLFPAKEVMAELERRGVEVFLITDARGMKFAKGFKRVSKIMGGQWSGEGLLRRAKTLVRLGIGAVQTLWRLLCIRPDMVVGMGGYISVPPVAIGKLLGRGTLIFNADSVLGNANMFLARFADKIALAFPGTEKVPRGKNTRVVGLPARPEIRDAAKIPFSPPRRKVVITVLGGSQGAWLFSDVLPKAFAMMGERTLAGLRIVQQARPEDMAALKKKYAALGLDCEIRTFFGDPAGLISKTHIFIGRAGANSVYEIGLIGRPAIFVPIEHRDGQQVKNALLVGGAVVVRERDFSPAAAAAWIGRLAASPNLLELMAKKAKVFDAGNDAAKNIVDFLYEDRPEKYK